MQGPVRSARGEAVAVLDADDVEAGDRDHEDAVAGAQLLPAGPDLLGAAPRVIAEAVVAVSAGSPVAELRPATVVMAAFVAVRQGGHSSGCVSRSHGYSHRLPVRQRLRRGVILGERDGLVLREARERRRRH